MDIWTAGTRAGKIVGGLNNFTRMKDVVAYSMSKQVPLVQRGGPI